MPGAVDATRITRASRSSRSSSSRSGNRDQTASPPSRAVEPSPAVVALDGHRFVEPVVGHLDRHHHVGAAAQERTGHGPGVGFASQTLATTRGRRDRAVAIVRGSRGEITATAQTMKTDVPAISGQGPADRTATTAAETIAATPTSGRPTATASTRPPRSRTPNHSHGSAIASATGSAATERARGEGGFHGDRA